MPRRDDDFGIWMQINHFPMEPMHYGFGAYSNRTYGYEKSNITIHIYYNKFPPIPDAVCKKCENRYKKFSGWCRQVNSWSEDGKMEVNCATEEI